MFSNRINILCQQLKYLNKFNRPVTLTNSNNINNPIIIQTLQSSGNDSQQVSEESPNLVRAMPFMQKVGGLGALVEKDDEVTAVVDKIKPALEEKTGLKFESLEVIHYKSQVVAGTNYFVKAKAKPVGGDEQIVHLRIYQDLKQDLELTAYQMGKLLGDEVTYFQ